MKVDGGKGSGEEGREREGKSDGHREEEREKGGRREKGGEKLHLLDSG